MTKVIHIENYEIASCASGKHWESREKLLMCFACAYLNLNNNNIASKENEKKGSACLHTGYTVDLFPTVWPLCMIHPVSEGGS